MEQTRRYILSHYPHGGPTELSDSMDAATLAHAYARKASSDDAIMFFATRVAPVMDREGYEGIRKWIDSYHATGSLWLS